MMHAKPPAGPPRVSADFMFGLLVGCTIMLPVWAVVFAVIDWLISR